MAESAWPSERIHHAWDLSLEPPLTIASGDTVHFVWNVGFTMPLFDTKGGNG
jgi:acetamidase/formamidase